MKQENQIDEQKERAPHGLSQRRVMSPRSFWSVERVSVHEIASVPSRIKVFTARRKLRRSPWRGPRPRAILEDLDKATAVCGGLYSCAADHGKRAAEAYRFTAAFKPLLVYFGSAGKRDPYFIFGDAPHPAMVTIHNKTAAKSVTCFHKTSCFLVIINPVLTNLRAFSEIFLNMEKFGEKERKTALLAYAAALKGSCFRLCSLHHFSFKSCGQSTRLGVKWQRKSA